MPKSDLKILEAAIKLEKDGRRFYIKASREAKNAPAKRLFASLADEELKHIERIEQIYGGLKEDKDWADFGGFVSRQAAKKLRLVFKPLSAGESKRLKANSSNLEAIKLAMKKERASYEFYDRQAKAAVAKIFYSTLKKEEERHYDLLEEAHTYLSDTAGWFVGEEGRVMEGG